MSESEKVILIVEDQKTTRKVLTEYLESSGYVTLEADTAVEAMASLSRRTVDLILMDVNLPEMDGLSACKKLKSLETTAQIPVLICTARGMKKDVMDAISAGANGYIVKPFNRKAVLERVLSLIGPAPTPAPAPPPPKAPAETPPTEAPAEPAPQKPKQEETGTPKKE